MTLRNSIIMLSHIETLMHIARDDPAFSGFLPKLEGLFDEARGIKEECSNRDRSNVVPMPMKSRKWSEMALNETR